MEFPIWDYCVCTEYCHVHIHEMKMCVNMQIDFHYFHGGPLKPHYTMKFNMHTPWRHFAVNRPLYVISCSLMEFANLERSFLQQLLQLLSTSGWSLNLMCEDMAFCHVECTA